MKKLNVGSGFRPLPGFDNCDINPECPDLTFVCPLEKIPVDDNTYNEVWSIHSIEHVSIPVAKLALAEWLRICAPGGFVHIDTPNIERNVRMYLDGSWTRDYADLTPAERDAICIDGEPNKTLWLNFKVFSSPAPYDTHFWNADAQLLQELCMYAGASKTEVYQTEPSLIIRAYK